MKEAEDKLHFTVLSCSLAPESRSRLLAQRAAALLGAAGHDTTFLDLRDHPLPPFDNADIFQSPHFAPLHRAISKADGIVLASPVYNWSLGAAAKNLVEATGATGENGARAAWFDKLVTFVCSGGMPHSYMAYSSLAMSLMLDFKCVINPYVVYASGRDWDEEDTLSAALQARLEKTMRVNIELAGLLRNRSYRSDWEI